MQTSKSPSEAANAAALKKVETKTGGPLALVFAAFVVSLICLGGRAYYQRSSTVTGGITCALIADQFKAMSHDAPSLCAKMQSNGATAAHCTHLKSLCTGSAACTLQQVYLAVDMKCPVSASMAEQKKPKLSCAEIATTFRTGAPFHHKKLCATMAANGAVPSCCMSDAMDCCQDVS